MPKLAEKVPFALEDGFVAQHARDMVISDDWRGALRMLTEKEGFRLSLDNAVKVLTGECDIEMAPNGGCCVVPQKKNQSLGQYLHTAAWQKAGILAVRNMFYQPYALLDSFCPDDEKQALAHFAKLECWISPLEYRTERAKYHMKDPRHDLVFFDIDDKPVLFQRVLDPAFWVETFSDAKSAYVDFLKKRASSLEYLGAEADAANHSLNPRDIAFYFKAALSGILISTDYDLLSEEDGDALAQVLASHDELSDAISNLGDQEEPQFSGDGYEITEESLREQFEKNAYHFLFRVRIDKQARTNGGYMALSVAYPDGVRDLQVPAAPFLHWAKRTRQGNVGDTLPEWERVCPHGLKMQNDDPMHSDWWVGAGLPIDEAYDRKHPVTEAAWLYAARDARENGGEFVKLAGKGSVSGTVVFPRAGEAVPAGSIAVVSHAGTDYELALLSACKGGAGAVIAEVGGKLAHLAIVSREVGARLVVMENALSRLQEGNLVMLDFDKGTVEVFGQADRD